MSTIDEEQFSAVFDRFSPAVLSYLLRRTDRANAEDALSETFLVVWRRRDEFPREPLPWLYAIARRVLSNQARSHARRAALDARLAQTSLMDPWVDAHESSISDPTMAALTALSPTDREVLLLHAWEELSRDEAAQVLGCRPATYAVRLHRASKRFKAALAVARPTAVPVSQPSESRT